MSGSKKKAPRINDLFANPKLALKAQTEDEKLQVCATPSDTDNFSAQQIMAFCVWLWVMYADAFQASITFASFAINLMSSLQVACWSLLCVPVKYVRLHLINSNPQLCVWSFQQLGVGSSAASEIATEAEVVDLLVCMATFSVKSARYPTLHYVSYAPLRKDVIFDPFPSVADPEDANKMLLSPAHKDFNKVEELLNKMPSIQVSNNLNKYSQISRN